MGWRSMRLHKTWKALRKVKCCNCKDSFAISLANVRFFWPARSWTSEGDDFLTDLWESCAFIVKTLGFLAAKPHLPASPGARQFQFRKEFGLVIHPPSSVAPSIHSCSRLPGAKGQLNEVKAPRDYPRLCHYAWCRCGMHLVPIIRIMSFHERLHFGVSAHVELFGSTSMSSAVLHLNGSLEIRSCMEACHTSGSDADSWASEAVWEWHEPPELDM